MKWLRYLPESIVALVAAVLEKQRFWDAKAASPLQDSGWSSQRKAAFREETRNLWYHGFDNYMRYAFPLDELTPLSCSGQGPDWGNPKNIASNDVMGNFSLTLIDVLDTFIVLDDKPAFENAVKNVIYWVSFDVNTKPQVFETTIRVLGGLLSGHIFANDTSHPFHLPWYKDELLSLAYDLGKRLLPAFATPTGLPYARINLRHGVLKGETVETCTAGAGSLMLEFATLSRLTGDQRFEKAAHKAFFALWNRKSDIGLVGNTINTWTGDWTSPEVTSIGAGIDSFYEYALKWYIMSGDVEFLDVWDDAYAAIMRYSRSTDGFLYQTVNIKSGETAYHTIDSLSAFWPGLQVLAGDIKNAIKLHLLYYNLWRKHSGLPEVYDTNFKQATSLQYPLRPEFVEATWYLYRATKDPFYLDVGARVLTDITVRAKVPCGLTGIQDLRTNKQDDRMESFVLSETLKYLFLLFDEDNPLHSDDSNYVFTTEGHILTLGNKFQKPASAARRKLRKIESHQCPRYDPLNHSRRSFDASSEFSVGVESRSDIDYARELVSLLPDKKDSTLWKPYGWCERPKVDIFSYDFVLSSNGKVVPEDLSPSLLKVALAQDGFVVQNVTGIRVHIVKRLDGKGYDVKKLGHYRVRPGQLVYINDTALALGTPDEEILTEPQNPLRDPDVDLLLRIGGVDPMLAALNTIDTKPAEISITGHTGFFGGDLSTNETPLRFLRKEGIPLFLDDNNTSGCGSFNHSYHDSALIVRRGECTFLQKLLMAKSAGAAGIVVLTDEQGGINPTASPEELEEAGDISDVVIVVLPKTAGEILQNMLISAEQQFGFVLLSVQEKLPPISEASSDSAAENIKSATEREEKDKTPHVLYLNGHPLLNTRLIV